MKEIEIVKKYTNWKNVHQEQSLGYKFYFETPFGEISELVDIKYFFTNGLGDYLIIVAEKTLYIGFWHNNETIYCFAECDSLQEACESL